MKQKKIVFTNMHVYKKKTQKQMSGSMVEFAIQLRIPIQKIKKNYIYIIYNGCKYVLKVYPGLVAKSTHNRLIIYPIQEKMYIEEPINKPL
jgi:hypothetical protein